MVQAVAERLGKQHTKLQEDINYEGVNRLLRYLKRLIRRRVRSLFEVAQRSSALCAGILIGSNINV